MYKNYVDAKEWYGKVDCENLSQVRDYCERRGYSTDYYILVDFSIPSGKKRFFIYDLQHGKCVLSSYCMHGSGKGNTDATPKFSNEVGSGCSSLGRYVMVGKGSKFKKSIRLRGLDKTNYLAETRGILIHSAGKVTRFSGKNDYIPIGSESRGCFTVSRDCMTKVMEIYRGASKQRPVMLYAKYK
ncbi:murein L,D-transpeptidase catalytic domain-containing protein [Leyella stercorea]|uniref:murein L,D-transpeptidase catalytic domain-containing protein n=1 Tax=Leyella stercorea TaxID=363265 RepID=UPI0026DBF873|nr:murein L,D-transpeptidase catalytic domain family protein [Leyella stercorea]